MRDVHELVCQSLCEDLHYWSCERYIPVDTYREIHTGIIGHARDTYMREIHAVVDRISTVREKI